MTRRRFVIQVWNGKAWRKVRGAGPYTDTVLVENGERVVIPTGRKRAERSAQARSNPALRRPSSTEGLPHRVVEIAPEAQP